LNDFAATKKRTQSVGNAQISNNSIVLGPSTQIRNCILEQTSAEGEQVLNHFLNRLSVITLKEGSRGMPPFGHCCIVPASAERRVSSRSAAAAVAVSVVCAKQGANIQVVKKRR